MNHPPAVPDPRVFEDASHLRSLAIAHYVLAGLTAMIACLPLIHVGLGIMMVSGSFFGSASSPSSMPPDQFMGWFFIAFGSVFVLLGWALAVAKFLVGRWLSARKHMTFCFVVACIECLNMPLGTILGVFTMVTLNKPSVKALFAAGPGSNNFIHS